MQNVRSCVGQTGGNLCKCLPFTRNTSHTHTRCACVSFIRGLPCIGISLCVLLTHIPRVCMSTFPKAGLKGWKSFSPCGPCLHGQQRSTTSKSCHCRLEKRKTTKNPTQRSIARHRWAGHGAFFCSCRVGGGIACELDTSVLNKQEWVKRFGIKVKNSRQNSAGGKKR